MRLIIGNKNYSSWSMRPWLMLRHFGLPFEEQLIELFEPGYKQALMQLSPTGKVPALVDGEVLVWESLAICEYLSERYLDGQGYPTGLAERARCRAYCAEMHGGFPALRSELPMNIRARRRLLFSDQVLLEIDRLQTLWTQGLQKSGGPWLFAEISIADFMYAPMVMRCLTYGVELSGEAADYRDRLRQLPAVKQWCDEAGTETMRIEQAELGEPC